MKRVIRYAYEYNINCIECGKKLTIFYTVPDYGEAPVIMKCKNCGEFYWYTKDDEFYINPLEKQLLSMRCEKCNLELIDTLVPTHNSIYCCGEKFDLDDNYVGGVIPNNSARKEVPVYLIYS